MTDRLFVDVAKEYNTLTNQMIAVIRNGEYQLGQALSEACACLDCEIPNDIGFSPELHYELDRMTYIIMKYSPNKANPERLPRGGTLPVKSKGSPQEGTFKYYVVKHVHKKSFLEHTRETLEWDETLEEETVRFLNHLLEKDERFVLYEEGRIIFSPCTV